MSCCSTGLVCTVAVSDDGTVHFFGSSYDQLISSQTFTAVPKRMDKLPKIKLVSCGEFFTVCVDNEGFMWSFGSNEYCQLGNSKTGRAFTPQKIQNIPSVQSISCGNQHTLAITNDLDLWSFGDNIFGQLCLGNSINPPPVPQNTHFSNISRVSAGACYSLFQNKKGEIFGCGYNIKGQLALGNPAYEKIIIVPVQIPNQPPDIIKFCCSADHSLFLNLEGNVYSAGFNGYGNLGLGHNLNQSELQQIPNIPPMKSISCTIIGSFLLDFNGNIWSCGENESGLIGHQRSFFQKAFGRQKNINVPTKIENLNDIQQMSLGCSSRHILVKDSQNKIYSIGDNFYGQLGTGDNQPISGNYQEISSEYFTIWGDELSDITKSRAKSARK